jgi:hypothetical protein
MATPPLVDDVAALSEALGNVLGFLPSENPLEPPKGKTNASSFLFEIRVLFALLWELKERGWQIDPVRRNGRLHFVRAPANKATGTYFKVAQGSDSFDLTQGTEILDEHRQTRAPDMSLQTPCGDNATHKEVLVIWDSKLRGAFGKPSKECVPDVEFRSFLFVCRMLGLQLWTPPSSWPNGCSLSSLITNGVRPTEPDSVFLDGGVSVIEQFAHGAAPWPSRAEHELHQSTNVGSNQTSATP